MYKVMLVDDERVILEDLPSGGLGGSRHGIGGHREEWD